MNTQANRGKGLCLRPFISFTMFASFGILAISGLLMYFWRALQSQAVFGLDRGAWNAMHTMLSFVAVAAAVLHVALNWKPLVSYLKRGSNECSAHWREFGLAALLVGVMAAGTILQVPPFSSIAPRKHRGGPPPGVRLEQEGSQNPLEGMEREMPAAGHGQERSRADDDDD